MSLRPAAGAPPNLQIVHDGRALDGDGAHFVEDLRIVAENLMSLADRVPEDRAEIVRTASDLVAGIADTL